MPRNTRSEVGAVLEIGTKRLLGLGETLTLLSLQTCA